MLVKDIYNLLEGLSTLQEKELPVSTAFKIQRMSKKVADEAESADKLRAKIVEKYKEKDLEDGQVQLKKNKVGDFNKEHDELMQQEVDVELDSIELSELESISVTPKTLGLIDSILTDAE